MYKMMVKKQQHNFIGVKEEKLGLFSTFD